MSEEIAECRRAFEQKFYEYDLSLIFSAPFVYADDDVHSMWTGFRAAWNLRQQAPDGWQLVPKMPTKKMRLAIQKAISSETGSFAADVWSAGLSAAPKPEDVK